MFYITRISTLRLLCLIAILAFAGAVTSSYAQDTKGPFSKADILAELKRQQGSRIQQGDLAAEISSRGINFEFNDEVATELQKAGARSFVVDAVRQAAEDAKRPRLQTPGPQPSEMSPKALTPEDRAKLPLLEQARLHAFEYVQGLPNFLVTQFVTRSVRTPQNKDWQLEDKLEVDLSYHEKDGEKFKLVKLNGRPTSQTYDSIGGATSTGEFGSMLGAVFHPESKAVFKEVKRETFRGRQAVVFEYSVKKANSQNQITDKSTNRTVVVAYSGSMWIDVQSGYVVRIEQSAEDIQRGFPVTMAENAVEFDWVTIAGEKYLMPVSAEMIMGRDVERYYSRNVIELKNYRVFDTDVKVILDKDPPM